MSGDGWREALSDGFRVSLGAAGAAGIAAAAGIAGRNPLSFLDGIVLSLYLSAGSSALLIPIGLAAAAVFGRLFGRRSTARVPFLVALFASCGVALYGLSWLHVSYLPYHPRVVRMGSLITPVLAVLLAMFATVVFAVLLLLNRRIARKRVPGFLVGSGALAAAAVAIFALLSSPPSVPWAPGSAEPFAPAAGHELRPRLLVIAADGLSWNVAGPMVRAGKMPNLAHLLQDGRGLSLHARNSFLTPVVWTTFATGHPPEEHGIVDFTWTYVRGVSRPYATLRVPPFVGVHALEKIGETLGFVRIVPLNATHRATPAIWEIASAAGVRTDVVGYPITWPAEPLHGVRMITDQAFVPVLSRRTWPDSLTPVAEEAIRRARAEGTGPFQLDGPVRTSVERDAARVSMARDLLRRGDSELVIIYLNVADAAGHVYWGFHRPEELISPPPAGERARRGDLLEQSYELLDHYIGLLLEAAGEGTPVMVLSDHGMRAQPRLRWLGYRGLRDGGHTKGPPGVWIASGAGFDHSGRFEGAADGLDVLPTMLAFLGLPVANDLKGSVCLELLAPDHPARLVPHARIRSFGPRPAPIPAPESEEADRELRDRLRSLGYMN